MNPIIQKEGCERLKLRVLIPLMLAIMVIFLIIATAVGAVSVPFIQTLRIILKNVGLLKSAVFPEGWEPIIFFVRFPRVLVAVSLIFLLAARRGKVPVVNLRMF